MNRKKFYSLVRAAFGPLKQSQVNGFEAILNKWETEGLKDVRWLAYMMATAWHETARTMQAIEEYGKGKGRSYGAIDPKTGKAYYGRGLVQLTWANNYKTMGKLLGIPLYEKPELALSLDHAVEIMFEGMMTRKSFKGDFTGKALENYFNKTTDDPIGARRIINGTDKATLIAGYHKKFLQSIVAAQAEAPEVKAEIEKLPEVEQSKKPNWNAPWVFANLTLLGRNESDPLLNAAYVFVWKLFGLYKQGYTSLIGNSRAWCIVRMIGDRLKVGASVKGLTPGAVSVSTFGKQCPFWFGAELPIRHKPNKAGKRGRHGCTFLYWIDKPKMICATLDGNKGNLFTVAQTNLSGNKYGHDELVGGPRWAVDEADGFEVSREEVLKHYPFLKPNPKVGDSTR